MGTAHIHQTKNIYSSFSEKIIFFSKFWADVLIVREEEKNRQTRRRYIRKVLYILFILVEHFLLFLSLIME